MLDVQSGYKYWVGGHHSMRGQPFHVTETCFFQETSPHPSATPSCFPIQATQSMPSQQAEAASSQHLRQTLKLRCAHWATWGTSEALCWRATAGPHQRVQPHVPCLTLDPLGLDPSGSEESEAPWWSRCWRCPTGVSRGTCSQSCSGRGLANGHPWAKHGEKKKAMAGGDGTNRSS